MNDARVRNIISKGPKYRFPSKIDFPKCRREIAASLNDYSNSVTMYNVRNIRISDSCVYAQIRKGLGMHLVTCTNCDTVPFLLLVQYKGGLSEIEFIVSLFSNACMILLHFLKILEILCTSHYIKVGIAHSC